MEDRQRCFNRQSGIEKVPQKAGGVKTTYILKAIVQLS